MVVTIKIVSWVTVSIFVTLQFLLLTFVLYKKITEVAFKIQATVCTGAFILLHNFMMIALYLKYTGNPYKSDQHYKHLRHMGFAAGYWSIALLFKFCLGFVPDFDGIVQNDDKYDDAKKILLSIMRFALNLICDVVPIMIVIDSHFVKISTFDFVRKFERKELMSNDVENVL